MAVSREQLAEYVAELGLPEEQTKTLTDTLLSNDKAATQFVGQRLRHADYTKKTQELNQHKQSIEAQATQQITEYATQLSAAQNKIQAIMGDMEKESISAATANARLRKVKETYNLSDDDIPAIEGVEKPAGTAPNAPSTVDIDAKLNDFRNSLIKTIREDLMAMPRVSAIQADISQEHQELTGKRLTRAEHNELLDLATKNKMRLEDAWEQKYGISALRSSKSDEEKKKKWQSEWEAEQRAKNSNAAMAGVRPNDPNQENFQSPVLGKKFQESVDPARPAADKSQPSQPAQQPGQSGPKLTGAERAAAKFLERRSNGIPMGGQQPPTP